MYSPVDLSLYEACVASDSTVYGFWLLVARGSASLPANPMSETVVRYMMISSVFELLICSGHTGRSLAQGPAPKAKTRFLWRFRRKISPHVGRSRALIAQEIVLWKPRPGRW